MASERLLRNAGLCRGVFDALRRLTETPYKGRFAELSERYEMGHFATGSTSRESGRRLVDLTRLREQRLSGRFPAPALLLRGPVLRFSGARARQQSFAATRWRRAPLQTPPWDR